MLKKLLLGLLVSSCTLLPTWANDGPTNLPPVPSSQMKVGKKLEQIWVDPSFDKSKGFQLAPLAYLADTKVSEVVESLKKSLRAIAKESSPYTLKVAVMKVSRKPLPSPMVPPGFIIVEGQIVDATGKVVACFRTREKTGNFWSSSDDFSLACEKATAAIAKDLL